MKGLFEEGTLHCNYVKSISLSTDVYTVKLLFVKKTVKTSAIEMCAECTMTLLYYAQSLCYIASTVVDGKF